MTQDDILQIFKRHGVLRTNGHYVYTGGEHSRLYFDKNRFFPHTHDVSNICHELALRFAHDNVQVVVGPALGGIVLAQWVAYHLSALVEYEVLAIHAERLDGTLQLRRGYDTLVTGKRLLVVEDTVTTGGAVREVVDTVRFHQGNVVGVGALNNGGNVTTKDVGNVPKLVALVSIHAERYAAESCPLCAQNIPINTEAGHGADFIAHH